MSDRTLKDLPDTFKKEIETIQNKLSQYGFQEEDVKGMLAQYQRGQKKVSTSSTICCLIEKLAKYVALER